MNFKFFRLISFTFMWESCSSLNYVWFPYFSHDSAALHYTGGATQVNTHFRRASDQRCWLCWSWVSSSTCPVSWRIFMVAGSWECSQCFWLIEWSVQGSARAVNEPSRNFTVPREIREISQDPWSCPLVMIFADKGPNFTSTFWV